MVTERVESGIVRLRPDDVAEAGRVLSEAFQEDPFLAYLMPDRGRRRRSGRWFMATGVGYGLRFGEVYVTDGDGVGGAAVWLRPGATDVTLPRMARSGMLLAPVMVGPAAFARLMRYSSYAERLHHEHAAEPHWYLMVLGVDASRRGAGLGGRLIAPVLAKADAASHPCYLETMNESNVSFYARHGFVVVAAGEVSKGGLHVWAMRRDPKG